jgi:hypothetical protein
MLASCILSVGAIFTCLPGGFYGKAPVLRGERVAECHVAAGQVRACFLPYSGSVVLPRGVGGKHVSCTVQSGIIAWCSPIGFTGSAVVTRPE